MKKIFLILSIPALLFSCQKGFTTEEKALISSANTSEPFRVLQTTNREDSLFLRRQSVNVNLGKDKKELQHLISRMRATLEVENGVGLAAPQIGVGRNLFLFMRTDKAGEPVEVVINPKITRHSDEMICFERDGCLSIPNMSGNSHRYKWIEVKYYDGNGKKITKRLAGHSRTDNFAGIIFQHEYDHLHGVLFIDKLCE